MSSPTDRTTTARAAAKQASLARILDAGAARMRSEGLSGAAIGPLMQEAGLTHGAFYAHFPSKDELALAAFSHGFSSGRPRWLGRIRDVSWAARLKRLAQRYLNQAHRDNLPESCGFAALASDAARAGPQFRERYEEELRRTLEAIRRPFADGDDAATDDAIALMALCVGGLSLSRAVASEALSMRILRVCQTAAATLADAADTQDSTPGKSK